LCLARRADAPIGEYRDAPHIVHELRGFQVGPALAEHNRNLPLVIQTVASVGVAQLAVGTDDLTTELPEAPEPGLADFLVGIALVGSAAHFHGHSCSVVGEVSARASDAGIIRPRGVQSLTGGRIKESFAAGSQFVLRLPKEVVERLFGVFERARAGFDQAREVGRHQRLGHFLWVGLGGAFA